jgi:folate-dependent phosphoribosylglycinamide formyltransferase PurN
MSETRIGILASHHGTTLQAIIDACRTGGRGFIVMKREVEQKQ